MGMITLITRQDAEAFLACVPAACPMAWLA
jgi:hypothetical protein